MEFNDGFGFTHTFFVTLQYIVFVEIPFNAKNDF